MSEGLSRQQRRAQERLARKPPVAAVETGPNRLGRWGYRGNVRRVTKCGNGWGPVVLPNNGADHAE
jgi:hypothetical protein